MYQNLQRGIDKKKPYLPLYEGTFEQFVDVGGKRRRYLVYIPEGARASTAGVFVLPENGKNADDLWCESAWRNIADTEETKEKLIVFFLEPENGVWNIDEAYGVTDGDVAYVDAVWKAGNERFKFCVHESKFYLAGCREGGTVANMAAMFNPAVYAGIVSIGGSKVSDQYMDVCAQALCTNLDGYIDEDARQGRKKGDIPMPSWIIDDPEVENSANSAVPAYWKHACGAAQSPVQVAPDTLEYGREEEPEYPLNQEKEAYRTRTSVIIGASKDHGRQLSHRIWKDFLYTHRRWMADPGGDLRVTRDPVRDLGMEYHFEEIGDWMREWYVYIPDTVRTEPGKKVPLVFAMHGYTCSGEIYAGNSEWYKVARDRGFIVVHPTATPGVIEMNNQACDQNNVPLPAWNFLRNAPDGPDELLFFKAMLERVCKDHPIDRTRVFATGHSHGSIMTQVLALAMPEVFAAVAPCSGVLFSDMGKQVLELPETANRPDLPVPIWMFGGEQEGWLMPTLPETGNDTADTLIVWRKNNHLDPWIPESWAEGWSMHGERWNDLTYEKGGIPMVKYTWVDYMPHATMTEMSYRIWDEFFSHFSRVDREVRYL